MLPANSKSLFHFLCDQMDKLDKGTISVEAAKAQAALAKQINMRSFYENDRSRLLMELQRHNKEFTTNIQLRELDSKPFDSTVSISLDNTHQIK